MKHFLLRVRRSDMLHAIIWAFSLAWKFNKNILILCCLVISAVSVLPAVALSYNQAIIAAIDTFIQTGNGSFDEIISTILVFGIITALVGLSNRLNSEFIYSIMFDSYYFGMEEILMDSVQRYTMEELLRKDSKDEYYACVMREGALTDFICGACTLLGKFVNLFSLLIVAFSLSKLVFVIGIVYIVLVIWYNLTFIGQLRRSWNEIGEKERLAGHYEGMVYAPECAKEIRIFNSSKYILEKWREAYGAIFDYELKNHFQMELRTFLSGMGFYIFLACMTIYSLFLVANGSMRADELLVIFTLCMNIYTAVSGAAQTMMGTDRGAYALERQYRVFEKNKKNPQDVNAEKIGREDSDIVFEARNLSYAYLGNQLALDNVSFSIKKGETIALVGLNGSGKSTLVKLLLQLYKAQSGNLYFYGHHYDDLAEGFLNKQIGVFFQDYYLFHMSIKENVGFGNVAYVNDTEKIQNALEKGGAAQAVAKTAQGMDSFIYKNIEKTGVDFSGGERQKIAISRTHMSDKEILIFDEPASMLDPIAELEQFMNIKDKVGKRTAILISHRMGFARLADRIILLDKGKVAEIGTHEELIAKNGLYAKLFHEQAQWYQKEGGTKLHA